jgi:hypothetical protein
MMCGECKHWTLGNKPIFHIRRGYRGQCLRPGGHCRDEAGQYLDDVNVPRFRYEREPAGAHFESVGDKVDK